MSNYINYLRSIIVLSFLAILILVSCSENKDVVDKDKINDSSCDYASSRVNVDASNPEIFRAITKDGESFVYYGSKNADGTVSGIYAIEYAAKDGTVNIIDLDEEGYVTNITNNKGASIGFEWLTATSAVVKAYSYVDNVYISTIVDFSNDDSKKTPVSDYSRPVKQRSGELSLEIIPFGNESLPRDWATAKSTPWTPVDDMTDFQEVLLTVYRCDNYCDTRNYLELRDSKTGECICKFIQSVNTVKGKYKYTFPAASYPSVAGYKELCGCIDLSLNNIQNVFDATLAKSAQIVDAMDKAVSLTGLDVLPSTIENAIVFVATVSDHGQQILQGLGGISGLIRRTDSEWYFKSYDIKYNSVCPVAFNAGRMVWGDERTFGTSKPTGIKMDLTGNPMINSFTLTPSCPKKATDYEVMVEYYCIPEGSTISMSVVGIDGYKNLKTEKLSGGGQAVLRVPGAETGVCDVCEVVIDIPGEKPIKMQASMVFGE